MPKTLKVFAPAKVNLHLKVKAKREDGFHELDTLFARLSVGDDLTFKRTDGRIRLRSSVKTLPVGPKNLVTKAAIRLKEMSGTEFGADIYLKKNMPIASGIGAGSSDAAAALIGLTKLWNLKISPRKLMSIAAEIGSDVPFFMLQCGYAHGKGRGEKLRALEIKKKLHLLLITPKLKITAKEAYGSLTPSLLKLGGTGTRVKESLKNGDIEKFCHYAHNSLGVWVEARYPAIRKLIRQMNAEGALLAMVSGSGPTVMGLYETERAAKKALSNLKKSHPRKFTVYTTTG